MSPVHYANSESGARNAVVKVLVIAGLARGEKNRSNKIYLSRFFILIYYCMKYFTGVPKRSIEPTAEGVRIRENVCHAKNVPRASLSPIAAT